MTFGRVVSCLGVVLVAVSCDADADFSALFGSGGETASADAGGSSAGAGGAGGSFLSTSSSSSGGSLGSPGSSGTPGTLGPPAIVGSPAGGTAGATGNAAGKKAPDASAPGTGGASRSSSDAGSESGGSVSTGVLPPIGDPGTMGPFTPATTSNIGPNSGYTSIQPIELGKGGVLHPILVWSPGAVANPAIYKTLLDHIASHGFVVISYNAMAQGPELTTAIDWIVSESTRQGSTYFGKVDTRKIAAGGQSAGSLATFNIADDVRLTTTLHINGGTSSPHTTVKNLVKPAQFICGDDPSATGGNGVSVSDVSRPNCDADFMMATTPVWYGDVIGGSLTTIIDNPIAGTSMIDPLKEPFLAATVAWLRWQLAGDETMKSLFVGSSCGYCKQPTIWKVQQKNLQ